MFAKIEYYFGMLVNSLGLPGFVQDVEYEAGIHKAGITVKRGGYFTVVSVNGLDVYFRRFSGKIDGVGFSLLLIARWGQLPNQGVLPCNPRAGFRQFVNEPSRSVAANTGARL
jgi:hypothetical protein